MALKPDKRAYATQLWAQRRGFSLAVDATAAQQAAFDCDRKHCAPKGWSATRAVHLVEHPARRSRSRAEALCAGAQIVVVRASFELPPACAKALVLGPRDFARGGAAEVFRAPDGWRVVWAQPLRGQRPWTIIQ